MRLSQMIGKRLKETPKEATTKSHQYLLRGGYIRPISTGIYTLLPLAHRIQQKIHQILVKEMNMIEGQQILMPLIQPKELWEQSGRYEAIGPELLRFKNRNENDMVLAMTHEESVAHMAKSELSSYKQLPVMAYQVQAKYRDEARPRAGLIRVREFLMKDAYSFHVTQECLEKYYVEVLESYKRFFKQIGLKNVMIIESDSGMMGGAVSHEFMAVADCGEDTIFSNEDQSYLANKEIAKTYWEPPSSQELQPLEEVETPNCKTIEEVATFMGVPQSQTAKAVFYQTESHPLVFVVVRGDREVNETKLKNHLKAPHIWAAPEEIITQYGSVPGYASPKGITSSDVTIIIDPSIGLGRNFVVGANKEGYHLKNFNLGRDKDFDFTSVDVTLAETGDKDPVHQKPLIMNKGIEVGNIFQLGTKYSEQFGANVLDKNGKAKPIIMGCYGIGLGRSLAAVIEQSHDEYGPIWPIAIAPYQVHICALNLKKDGVQEKAEEVYQKLQAEGFEVLYDDRNEKPGVQFNDADLIGIPIRLIISPKTIEDKTIEIKLRDGSFQASIDDIDLVESLQRLLVQLSD